MSQTTQLVSPAKPAAPATVIRELSFCKTTVRDLTVWLHKLPKANTGEYSRQIYLALSELSSLQAAPELRMQLLELLRPEVALITRQLEDNHLASCVILNARATKVANLCQTLQHHLNTGYKQIAVDLQSKKGSLLALAIQRTLHGLFTTLARSYLTYRNVPAGLWFEIHQMYRLSAHHGLLAQTVQDPLRDGAEQTLMQAYCCALLLGCSRANQMRQSDIKLLVAALPQWSQLVSLQDIGSNDALFAVALATDTPPRYQALLNLSGRNHMLGLNTRVLTEAILERLQADKHTDLPHNPIKPGTPLPLLQQLACAWGDIAKRDFPRTNVNASLELCLGMSAVHYHLADKKSFEQTLDRPLPEPSLQLSPDPSHEAADIWAMAVDVEIERNSLSHNGFIDYQKPGQEASSTEENQRDYSALYPVLTAAVVNQSPGGYCLEWTKDAPPNLQTGDLLALRDTPGHNWSIATVRWIRQNSQAGAKIGIELMAHRAEPCGSQLLRAGKAASNYLRALRIPAISAISRPAQLITAKVPFREGCTVTLNVNGEESRIVLGRLVQQTASYSQFEYAPAVSSASTFTPKMSPNPTDHAKVGDQDDFHSLWDLL